MDGARFGGSSKTTCYDFAAYDEFANIFEIEAANNDKDRTTAYRLRYQIYCVENPFEDATQFPDGMETDHLDDRAIHGLIRHRKSGIACGTVRLILPRNDGTGPRPSFYDLCDPGARFPVATTAEISRLATSKFFRQQCEALPDVRAFTRVAPLWPYITVSLIAFIIRTAVEHEFTHLNAVMKLSLMRLLERLGIYFRPVGGLVDYHGWRQPCYIPLTALDEEIAVANRRVWEILTDSGHILEVPREVQVA